MASSNLPFPCPDELKEALDVEAGKRNISRAALIRLAIAKEIGFDIKKANTRAPRPKIYESPEARKEAARSRAALKRKKIAEFLLAVERGDRAEDIAALAKSLKGMV